jgi:RHS repeat-associated protein
MGDGTTISAQNLTQIIARIAGTGTAGDTGDGGPALQAKIDAGTGTAERPADMAAGPDGSIYFVDFSGGTIRKIAPDGVITRVAGGGPGFGNGPPDPACATDDLGDGCQATDAVLNDVYGMTVGPDGSIYFTERDFGAVRKITPDGIVHLIGGTVKDNCLVICGSLGYTGDGVPAIGASLDGPQGIAVGPDGTVYIADIFNDRIRSIGTDGLIETLVNVGNDGLGQLATGPDGSVYYVQSFDNIYRIDPSGTVSNVTGGSTGIPAIGNAGVNGLFVDRYGDLYFDRGTIETICHNNIFEITPDGIEHNLAGQPGFFGSCPTGGDGGAATQARIASGAMTVAPDGGIYESDGSTIRKVGAPLPGVGHQGYLIASPDGNQLFSFDASGKQQQTFNALTGAVELTFGYDPTTGYLTSITDANGNVTTIQHDATGNPTSITSPFGQVTTLTTDANGYLSSISDPLDDTTSVSMDGGGLLQSITGANHNTFTASYDSLGLLTATTDPEHGGFTIAGSDSPNLDTPGRVVTATNALGRVSTLTDTTDGSGMQHIQTALPDGTVHQRSLDTALNNAITDGAGNTSSTQFTSDPQLGLASLIAGSSTMKTPGGLTESTSTTKQVTLHDPTDPRTVTAETTSQTVNGQTFTSTYTANLNPTTGGPAGTGGTTVTTSPLNRTTTTVIDGQGRITGEQTGTLAASISSYNSRGQLISTTRGSGNPARTTTYTYGSDGRLSSVTDPLGRVTVMTYDAAGHLLTQTVPGQGTLRYTYDGDGNLASTTTPAGRTWRYTYNGDDEIVTLTPPTAGSGNPAITYTYTADRQLASVTRSDGQTVSYTYDATTGKPSGMTIPQGSSTNTYDPHSGLLTGTTAPGNVATSLQYDGSLLTGVSWSGPVAGTVNRSYDAFFRPSSDAVAGGSSVSYQYDNDGLPTAAGDLAITNDPVNGLVTGTSLGSVSTTTGYDSFGEVTSGSATANSSTLLSDTYTRDNLGRITSKSETIGGQTHSYSYTYGPQTGRLIQVQKDGSTVESYAYDSDGNRLTGPGASTPATYDAQGELTAYGSATYAYDVAGNRASKTDSGGTTSYVYDPLGNLRSVTLPNSAAITYLVDGKNERIGKEVNGTLVAGYLYDQEGRIIALLDGTGAVRSQFVYAPGAATPSYLISGGTEYRILVDQTGSPRLVVNAGTGQVEEQLDYDSFGNQSISQVAGGWDPTLLPFGFAGGLRDSDTGLLHLGARDYDPQTGTWTARDPLSFGAGDTTLYGYAHDDPINLADASGLGPFTDQQLSLGDQFQKWLGENTNDPVSRFVVEHQQGVETTLVVTAVVATTIASGGAALGYLNSITPSLTGLGALNATVVSPIAASDLAIVGGSTTSAATAGLLPGFVGAGISSAAVTTGGLNSGFIGALLAAGL